MTVQELIDRLEYFPPTMDVIVDHGTPFYVILQNDDVKEHIACRFERGDVFVESKRSDKPLNGYVLLSTFYR